MTVWPTTRLHEIAKIRAGGSLQLTGKHFVAAGVPAYGAGGLNGYVTTSEYEGSAIILSSIGARCGKCFYVNGEWTSLANTQVIFPDPARVDAKFLWYQLNDERRWHRSGTAQPFIKPADVKNSSVFLPSLAKQKRIADVLDRTDALRTKRRVALALLDDLSQSIFLDMFGDPMANDRGWPAVSVAEFVNGFESGKNLVADDLSDRASRYRVLRTSAITSLRFRPDQTKPVPQNYEPPLHHLVKDGDLLFGRANTGELIGATALVKSVGSNVLLPDKIWRFKWPPVAASDPIWVMHLFRTPAFRHELTRRASGTSSSMKNISQQKVLSIRTGLPDLALQRAFAEKVAASESTHTFCERSGNDLARMFASLQQQAFAGEL